MSDTRSNFSIVPVLLLVAAAAAFFLYCAGHAVHKPFSLDETDIALRAHLIVHEGLTPAGFVRGQAEALTHPPLYEFVVALLFRLGGERESVARGFGAVCYLIICLFSCLTLNELLRSRRAPVRSWAIGGLTVLCLLNPLMIQHAMLIDADTTGTALCTALFFYIFVRSQNAVGYRYFFSRMGLAAVMAFMFLFKEMGPFLILSGVSAYHLLNRDFKKLILDLVLILGVGAAAAWAVWAAYAHALGMDPARIYVSQGSARYSRIITPAFVHKVWRALPVIIRWPIYWNSAPLVVLLGLSLLVRIKRGFQLRRLETVDALWLSALCVWIPFLLFKPSIDMMKYQFPVYPLMFVAVIYGAVEAFSVRRAELSDFFGSARGRIAAGGGALLAGFLFFYYHRLGDYILLLFNRGERPVWKEFIAGYCLPLAALTVLLILAGFFLKKMRLVVWVGGLLLATVPIHTALNLRQIGDYTTAESWMNYGEKGLKETVDYLAAQVRPGTVACWRKDIQYYIERKRGIRPISNLQPTDLYRTSDRQMAELERLLRTTGMDFIVTDVVSLFRVPEDRMSRIDGLIQKYFVADRVFGSFKIYRNKSLA